MQDVMIISLVACEFFCGLLSHVIGHCKIKSQIKVLPVFGFVYMYRNRVQLFLEKVWERFYTLKCIFRNAPVGNIFLILYNFFGTSMTQYQK